MPAFSGNCKVKGAGAQQGKVTIKLDADDGSFTGRWFLAATTPREILATALAAISTERGVYADVDDLIENSPITGLIINF